MQLFFCFIFAYKNRPFRFKICPAIASQSTISTTIIITNYLHQTILRANIYFLIIEHKHMQAYGYKQ